MNAKKKKKKDYGRATQYLGGDFESDVRVHAVALFVRVTHSDVQLPVG
jgi:hypothetical protein